MSAVVEGVATGDSPSATIHGPEVARRWSWTPLVATVTVGILLSILPHLAAKTRTGSFDWVADTDELGIYLPVASKLYHSDTFQFQLSDPVSPRRDPTVFPWTQLAPGALIARALKTGPLPVGLIWRTLAGLMVGLAWYLLFFYWCRTGWLASAAAIFLMADWELLTAKLFFRQILVGGQLMTGAADHLLATKPNLMPQWRIMTPGLSLGFLLFYASALLRALDRRTMSAVTLAGVACGALFYVYFYYWTAAGLSLLMCAFLFRQHRHVFLATGAVGVVLGLPSLISNYLFQATFNSDWLARTDKFVEIGHFQDLILPKIGPMLAVVAVGHAVVR